MLTELNIRKFLAPEIIFGDGAIELLGRYVRNYGAGRVFIVTDQGLVQAGLLERAQTILAAAGVDLVVYDKVSPNPRDYEVMEAAELYHQSHCDIIIALGGGSPMDCAKGVSIVSANNNHILTFKGVDNVEIPGPPLICLPTTSGTSADVSQFAIINNTEERVKVAIISKTMVPDLALLDPGLTLTMNRDLTLCTGMDALVHAIEAYVSSASSQLTDLHALEAIRLIQRSLPKVLDNLNDVELREQMMLASLEAGLAFSNASLGAVHAMAHSLGGLLDLPHGECNTLLLDAVIKRNYEAVPERYDRIGEIFGVQMQGIAPERRAQAVAEAVLSFKRQLGFESGLDKRGVRLDDITLLAQKALADPCMVTNPRRFELADIEAIFKEAL
ncbi:iron-containing alcohol dehydrogenase [Desulfobulbus rhabdoformis]|uniref:alcohol dehydrogenase-like regulatory protein ErcA n=1 Tax=Desulfobulbus rhabdoformis TaxID=34032 RepID=UPI001965B853|nr:alcohol dehydrogenase-like regulatory protein ErcA [Desulfobulbus rhabdoformis]MBM9614584.1 iron-containing alcohol dehydrogenase [Desulfobulbus rhabdoformis]